VLLTLHRPSNVDDEAVFERLIEAIGIIAADRPVMFPVHPRTRPTVARSKAATAMMDAGRLRVVDPLGYLEFLGLMEGSRAVLTDSGGVQEETTILGIPCLTLRENTERPVTIAHGTNRLVGTDPARILQGWHEALSAPPNGGAPPLWDGNAAARIVDVLAAFGATPVSL
jgi:UDP-N-acetylglucosamine 2-epimerase (non-hydrolysing)